MQLIAASKDDLVVMSALVQDGVCRIRDLHREAGARRFTLGLNRFRWELVPQDEQPLRIRSGLMIEGVNAVRTQNLERANPDAVVDILALTFEPDQDNLPAGTVRIVLAGGGEIAMDVECLDITLADVSNPWRARRQPDHESDG